MIKMTDNIKRVSELMNEAVNNQFPVGGKVSVIRKGETVYRESFGYADKEKGIKMGDNAIFRLFSLSKPVTAAAVMLLVERGKIELRYPVKWFLPTFENPMVIDEKGVHPADRDVTIGDLLTMTSGVAYPGGDAAGQKMGELWGMQSYNYLNGGDLLCTKDFVLEMGKKPLAFTPGEKWMYGGSADVLGGLVEVISGMKFGDFLKKEIFEPLGMNDTGFWIPEEKYGRLAQAYNYTSEGNMPFTEYSLCLTDYRKPPAFESGGAGLVSTIEDYEKFVKMLMGKGKCGDVRILGRKTVELMSRNFLDEPQMASLDWDSMKGQGYGALMRVMTDRTKAGRNGTEGEYGWDGWMGCYFSIDPAEELAMLYFIQQTNSGCTDFTRKLQNVIWGALE